MNAYQRNMGILSENEGKLKKLQEEHKRLEKAQNSSKDSLNKTKIEFDAFSKVVDNYSNKIEATSQKIYYFTKVVDNQKKVLKESKKDYLELKKAIKNKADATDEEKEALERAYLAYVKNQGVLAENQKQLKGLKEEHKRLEKAQKNATLSTKLFGDSVGKTFAKMRRSLNGINEKMATIGETMSFAVTTPIVGGFSMATRKAIEFEDQMTKLKSVMDDSSLQGTQFKTLEEGMNGLKEASLNLSKTYGESTEKINEGMIELAKNGYKIKEITDISNQGMLGAKATGEDYNSVISTLSGTMRTFGLLSNDQKKNAENTKMAMEQLVSVANSSATGVGELGYAFSKMGGLAKASGMDIAQAGSMFGVLRDRNIEASTAATSLKSGLINISKAAKAVAEGGDLNNSAKAFLELGINLEDVYKNGIDLPKLLREMQKGSAGMTAEAKKAALGAAFGKETVASWVALMDEKAIKSLEEYTKKARESNGSLDELFETMRKSPKMAVDIFKSSISVLGIKMGETFIQNMAPILVNITDFVNKLTDLEKPTLNNVINFGLLVASIGPLTFGFSKLIKGALNVGKTIGGLPLPFKIAVGAIAFFVGKMATKFSSFDSMIETISSFQNTIQESFKKIAQFYEISGLKDSIEDLMSTFNDLFSGNFGGEGTAGTADNGIVKKVRDMASFIEPILSDIVRFIDDSVKTAIGIWNRLVDIYSHSDLPKALEDLRQSFSNLFSAKFGGNNGANIEIINLFSKLFDASVPVLEEMIKLLTKTLDVLNTLPDGFLPGVLAFSLFSKAVLGATRKVKVTIDKVREVKNTVMTIPGKFKQGIDSVSNLKNKFSSLKTKVGEAKDKINRTKDSVANIPNKFKAGADGVRGLKDKFSSLGDKASRAKNKISDVYNSLMKKPKKGNFDDISKELDNVASKGDSASGSIQGVIDSASGVGSQGGSTGGVKGGKTSKKGKGKIAKFAGKVGGKLFKKGAGKAVGKAAGYFALTTLSDSLLTIASSAGVAEGAVTAVGVATSLLSGPFGVAMGVIGVLGAGFITLYNKCEPFRKFVDGIGEKVKKAFNACVAKAADFSKKFYDNVIMKTINPISVGVGAWNIARKFKERFDASRKEGKTFNEAFTGALSDMLKDMADKIKNSKIAQAFRDIFNQAMKWVATPINGIIDAANWVIHKLGGEENKFKHWDPPTLKYAKGTGNGGHPGGLAMVNDERGATYREAVTLPNGRTFIPQGRNVVMNLPRGTQVAPAKVTRNAVNKGILRYKDGTNESWLSKAWNFGKKAVSKIGDFVGDVMEYMTDPGKLARKVLSYFVSFGKAVRFPLDVGKGIVRNSVDALTNRIKEMFDAMSFEDGANGLSDTIAANGVYQYLVNIAKDVMSKFGGQITSGYRPGSVNEIGQPDDHSKRLAIDISGVGYNTYDKMKHYVVNKYRGRGLSYVIANNTWATKRSGYKFVHYPYGGHMDHIHISGEKPTGKIYKASASGGSYAGKGSIPNPPGSGVNRWIPMIKETARRMGVHLTPAGLNAVLARIRQESNGDPNAINLWDSNAAAGHPSQGILQYIQPTLNQWVPRGVQPVLKSGYAQLMALFNDSNWYYDITRPGGWGPTGKRRKYEKGGLVTQHQIAEIGEGNKPEMVIPLTDTSRSVRLIRQAQKLVGEEHFESKYAGMNNDLLAMMINEIRKSNEILTMLFNKDSDIYLDSNLWIGAIREKEKKEQVRRSIASGNI